MTEKGDFGPAYKRPAWAITEEITEDRDMIFRDGDGEGQRLWAKAFTDSQLRLLRLGLAQLP